MTGYSVAVIEVYIIMTIRQSWLKYALPMALIGLKIGVISSILGPNIEVIIEIVIMSILAQLLKRKADQLENKTLNLVFKYYD